jgi:hypothetical protein
MRGEQETQAGQPPSTVRAAEAAAHAVGAEEARVTVAGA